MKARFWIALAALILTIMTSGLYAAPGKKSLLEELGLPIYPGSKLASESVIPAGPILDQIEEEYGQMFAVTDLKQVSLVTYALDSDADSSDVLKFYDPAMANQKWKAIVQSSDRQGGASSVLINDKLPGLLIINIDSPSKSSRQMTFLRVIGSVNTSALAGLNSRVPQKVGEMVGSLRPGILVGQPISVPPSEKLNIQAVKSVVTARFGSQNTVDIELSGNASDTGDMTRTQDGRLLLALAPKLPIDEITLPANVPVLLELTEGSLALTGGSGPNGRPTRLNVISTGAPVSLDYFPLVSGTHSIKVVGKSVDVVFSQVQGGNLDIEAQGGNISLSLPKNASTSLALSAPSGKIQNLTGVEPQKTSADAMALQIGDGKAAISAKAINGTVTVRFGD